MWRDWRQVTGCKKVFAKREDTQWQVLARPGVTGSFQHWGWERKWCRALEKFLIQQFHRWAPAYLREMKHMFTRQGNIRRNIFIMTPKRKRPKCSSADEHTHIVIHANNGTLFCNQKERTIDTWVKGAGRKRLHSEGSHLYKTLENVWCQKANARLPADRGQRSRCRRRAKKLSAARRWFQQVCADVKTFTKMHCIVRPWHQNPAV